MSKQYTIITNKNEFQVIDANKAAMISAILTAEKIEHINSITDNGVLIYTESYTPPSKKFIQKIKGHFKNGKKGKKHN